MLKRIIYIFLCLLTTILLTGCQNEQSLKKNIQIIIIAEKSKVLYNKNIETTANKIVDVLKNENLSLKIEDGPYGAYIMSLMDLEQKNDKDGTYYWAYYINDKYAEVGISNCKIKEGDTYKFVYEFYKN